MHVGDFQALPGRSRGLQGPPGASGPRRLAARLKWEGWGGRGGGRGGEGEGGARGAFKEI